MGIYYVYSPTPLQPYNRKLVASSKPLPGALVNMQHTRQTSVWSVYFFLFPLNPVIVFRLVILAHENEMWQGFNLLAPQSDHHHMQNNVPYTEKIFCRHVNMRSKQNKSQRSIALLSGHLNVLNGKGLCWNWEIMRGRLHKAGVDKYLKT